MSPSRGPSADARYGLSGEFVDLGAATLGECGALPMSPRLKAAWPGAVLAGPAVTVRCAPGDNLAIHVALLEAPEDSVLVVDCSEVPERGYWGEVLATAAMARGVAGLVIDGGVRDTGALRSLGFPAFSSVLALRGATKLAGGEIGGPVEVGDVTVSPGDWVVGDVDGVVVVPGGRLAEVAEAAHRRAKKEGEMFAALREGSSTVELLGLDPSAVKRVS